MSWNNFWNGEGLETGEFAYGTTYTICVISIVVAMIVFLIWGSKKPNCQRNIIVGIAIFQLVFEVFWRVIYFVVGNVSIGIYPIYPCNLAGILVPIAALAKNNTMKKMFYFFAFIGGVITFAQPIGIFNDRYLTFPILKSVLQHTGIIIVPVLEFAFGIFRPKIKQFGWLIAGTLIHVVNSEGVAALVGDDGDYMFFRSGLPFVIEGVPQWITFTVFGVVALFALSCLVDPLGTKQLFTSLFAKKTTDKQQSSQQRYSN